MLRIDRGPFRRKGVDEYVSRMSKPREAAIYDSTVTQILANAGYVIPEDPASLYDPSQLWDQLERYCTPDVKLEEDEFLRSAIRKAYRAFGYRENYGKLSILENEGDILKAIKLEKSAGIYMTDKASAWPRGWTRSLDVISGLKKPNPCLAGVRTQRGNKTRLVWMYPLEMTILEAKFARPLIECFKNIRTPMPYSLRRYQLGARLSYTMIERNNVSLDFSKFDSSVPSWLIKKAFKILGTWFDFNEDTAKVFDKIQYYFINTPLVMIDGHLYHGKNHGVPSGSYFTQLIDSIVNYIIITAAMQKYKLHHHEGRVHVLGDDSVFSTNVSVNLNELKSYFATFGFNLNVTKSAVTKVSEPYHFVGFEWFRGSPNRDLDKSLLSMTQPEKWRMKSEDRVKEISRAMRLVLEMSTLGGNLYEVIKSINPSQPRNHLYLEPENRGLTDYMRYHLEESPINKWRNIASGMWI